MSGHFIVLEGIDAGGTTTQCAALADVLRSRGYDVTVTCEPTGGAIGKQIRSWLAVGADRPSAHALALLFAADRLEHIDREILPALARGEVVICDRYFWSSFAYQGLDCELSWLAAINEEALRPDLAIWLNVPLVKTLRRSAARLTEGTPEECFDPPELQVRLHDAYNSFANLPAQGFEALEGLVEIDGDRSITAVTYLLLERCVSELGL